MHSTEPTPASILANLAAVPRRDDLARLVHTLLLSAADERRTRLSDGLAELAERLNISADAADTPLGNVLSALQHSDLETSTSPGAMLLSALLARSVALLPPEGAAAEVRIVEALVWLAAFTPVDALPALDGALGPRADALWRAAADLVRRCETGGAPHLGRAGAFVAAAALRSSPSITAAAEADALLSDARDPILRSLLRPRSSSASPAGDDLLGGASSDAITVKGELVPPPRGPVAFVAMACTGVLALLHVGRFIGRWGLLYKKPAEISVTSRGVTVNARTELLGRTIREQKLHIPVESLLRATREVKLPRLGLYAGLFALAVGSYFGIGLFVDGARVGSPELLGVGVLLVALGVGLDFALVNLGARGQGRCRMIIVPRKGPAFAMGGLNAVSTDAALRQLTRRA